MAEAIAHREAAEVIEPASAGLYPLGRIAERTIETLVATGYSADGLSSKSISREAVEEADLIVNLSGARIDYLFASAPSKLRHSQQLETGTLQIPMAKTQPLIREFLKRSNRRCGSLQTACELQKVDLPKVSSTETHCAATKPAFRRKIT